jgi:flagellar biosynthesis protein FlhA
LLKCAFIADPNIAQTPTQGRLIRQNTKHQIDTDKIHGSYGGKNPDPDYLTAMVRSSLKRLILQNSCGHSKQFSAITLAPDLEQILQQSMQLLPDQNISLEPGLAEKIHASLSEFEQKQSAVGEPAILLVSPTIRMNLARLFRNSIPGLSIISYQELPDDRQVNIVGSIGA